MSPGVLESRSLEFWNVRDWSSEGAGKYAGLTLSRGRAPDAQDPGERAGQRLPRRQLPHRALSSPRETSEPAVCHGRQTSHEQPVCLRSRALSIFRLPVTQLPDNCALQLSPKQAWGGRRYEARDPLPPTTLAQHSPKMGRLEQALRGARGGKTERNRGRMKKEGKGEGEEGTGREGRLPKCRAGQEGDGKSTTAKRQRCGEEREHSS